MPISAIVEYTFYKVNSYFVHRHKKARQQITSRPNQDLWGKGAKKLLTKAGKVVVDSDGCYSAQLGRDWIHVNCCVPSTMHQCLMQWDGDEVEVVQADDSCDVSMVDPPSWWGEGTECLTGRKEQDWCFVNQ